MPGISEGRELGQLVFISSVFHISRITLLQCLMSSDLKILFHILSSFLFLNFFSFSLFSFLLPSFLSSFHSFLFSIFFSCFLLCCYFRCTHKPFILTKPEAEISVLLLFWLKENDLIIWSSIILTLTAFQHFLILWQINMGIFLLLIRIY